MGMRKKIRKKKSNNRAFRSNEYFSNLYKQATQLKTTSNSMLWIDDFSDEYIDQYLEKLNKGTLTLEEKVEFDKKFIKFIVA